MAATQHWLKTDMVHDEELRMIRAQVFEAIQRKRSELHRDAAAVLRAERWGFFLICLLSRMGLGFFLFFGNLINPSRSAPT